MIVRCSISTIIVEAIARCFATFCVVFCEISTRFALCCFLLWFVTGRYPYPPKLFYCWHFGNDTGSPGRIAKIPVKQPWEDWLNRLHELSNHLPPPQDAEQWVHPSSSQANSGLRIPTESSVGTVYSNTTPGFWDWNNNWNRRTWGFVRRFITLKHQPLGVNETAYMLILLSLCPVSFMNSPLYMCHPNAEYWCVKLLIASSSFVRWRCMKIIIS